MGVVRDFYNSHSLFPEKVITFVLGLFLNEISNFPPFCFSSETYSGSNGKVRLRTQWLNRYVRALLNHDVATMRVIVNILKQT